MIRDLRQDSRGSENVRKYQVTKAFPFTSRASDLYQEFGFEICEWIWNGFNASVVTYGQSNTGKTHLLFNQF